MLTIHKYAVPIADRFTLEMPEGAQVLGVQVQYGEPCVWALVDSARPAVGHSFALRGTGHDCAGLEAERYIGTFQSAGGRLVFHLFKDA